MATVLVGQNREKKKRRRRDRGWRASSKRTATAARWGMRAASFEATEGLDALADAEIANGKDVGKARAAALVVGRKKGNGVEADGRGEGGDENPTTEEVQEGGQRQYRKMVEKKRRWRRGYGCGSLSNGERRQGREEEGRRRGRTRDRKTMVWGRNRGMEERKKKRATALAAAAMKRRTKTWAERGRWIRQEEKLWAASWGRRWLKIGRERRCWRWRVKKEGRGWEETGGNTGCFPRF